MRNLLCSQYVEDKVLYLLSRDLVDILLQKTCVISINNLIYNPCCYADDLQLCSLSVLSLQILIDDENKYMMRHGLCFIHFKTKYVAISF